MTKRLTAVSLVALLVAAGGCGKSKEQQEAEAAQRKLQDALGQLQKQAAQAGKTAGEDLSAAVQNVQAAVATVKKVDPVDFQQLKATLPETLVGLKRTGLTGEKAGAMGMVFSRAEATYESQDAETRLTVRVVDNAGLAGAAAAAQVAWATVEVEKETDNGYEKSVTVDGFKGMERYQKDSRSGSVCVLIQGRFVIEVEASGVESATLRKLTKELPLSKINGFAK
jgi:hypothetical protein